MTLARQSEEPSTASIPEVSGALFGAIVCFDSWTLRLSHRHQRELHSEALPAREWRPVPGTYFSQRPDGIRPNVLILEGLDQSRHGGPTAAL